MLFVECGDYDDSGIADLGEAVALAKERGIANARRAVHRDELWLFKSLAEVISLGIANVIPGVRAGVEHEDIGVRSVRPQETLPELLNLFERVETRVLEAARDELPGWRPTQSPTAVRLVTMRRKSQFRDHTDDYEGLVASVQLDVEGEKTMRTYVGGEWHEEQVRSGDVTLFACDTFSERSRTPHGFDFTGSCAVAFTLGQDPFYTISGRLPMVEEHPEYFT